MPYYRTYLEHSWLRLGPKQSTDLLVMTESLDGDPAVAGSTNRELLWDPTNLLEISGWVNGVCKAQCTGGAAVEVHSGRTTTIRDIGFNPEPAVVGRVLLPNGSPVTRGTVLATARRQGEGPEDQLVAHGDVRNDGRFFVFMPGLQRGMETSLSYLGDFSFAPTEAGPLVVEF